ncbi:MAG: hypothetical protein M1396_00505 [Chloroflexi bacterium]|nr:hypothetical protein [Chloroflexota bacterium]
MSLTEMVIRGLVADHNIACIECGTRFRRSGLRVVRQGPMVWHISARCAKCGSTYLLVVRIDDKGLAAAGSAQEPDVELDVEEAELFAQESPISADDVLAIGDLLERVHTMPELLHELGGYSVNPSETKD